MIEPAERRHERRVIPKAGRLHLFDVGVAGALTAHARKVHRRIVICLVPRRMRPADAEAIPRREFPDESPD